MNAHLDGAGTPLLIYVLNGPNLNRLGTREPEIYGTATLVEIERWCHAAAAPDRVRFRQSNAEQELIDWIHEAVDERAGGIVINPAGFTTSSVAIVDALKMFPGSIIELHVSNPARRESYYHGSLVSVVATATITGLGARGYVVAVGAIRELSGPPEIA
jgi:3-dehydroquinate dehydratase-2